MVADDTELFIIICLVIVGCAILVGVACCYNVFRTAEKERKLEEQQARWRAQYLSQQYTMAAPYMSPPHHMGVTPGLPHAMPSASQLPALVPGGKPAHLPPMLPPLQQTPQGLTDANGGLVVTPGVGANVGMNAHNDLSGGRPSSGRYGGAPPFTQSHVTTATVVVSSSADNQGTGSAVSSPVPPLNLGGRIGGDVGAAGRVSTDSPAGVVPSPAPIPQPVIGSRAVGPLARNPSSRVVLPPLKGAANRTRVQAGVSN